MIQEHQARSHHFDFRLEVDGVLKSWAVPKGPSTDPRERRLAMAVEDHPLDYADFEGVIPEGQYGAGAVIVWDRGTYDNLTEQDGAVKPAGRALEDGHLRIELHGQKLEGGYALQRVGGSDQARWLLIKLRDQAADARRRPTSSQPKSVASGRTVAGVAKPRAPGRPMADLLERLPAHAGGVGALYCPVDPIHQVGYGSRSPPLREARPMTRLRFMPPPSGPFEGWESGIVMRVSASCHGIRTGERVKLECGRNQAPEEVGRERTGPR